MKPYTLFKTQDPEYHTLFSGTYPYIPIRECPLHLGHHPKGEGGGGLGLTFAGYVPLASQSPYPIIVYSVANYTPHLSHFWQTCNFRDPNLVTFYLLIFSCWMKNTLLFDYSTNILVRNMENCVTPNIRKCATPSSGTSTLACYKEVHSPGASYRMWNTFKGNMKLVLEIRNSQRFNSMPKGTKLVSCENTSLVF